MEWWSTWMALWSMWMASEIAMLTTLEMQNVNFRQHYCVLGYFKNSLLTVVLVDGVVVDVDGV